MGMWHRESSLAGGRPSATSSPIPQLMRESAQVVEGLAGVEPGDSGITAKPAFLANRELGDVLNGAFDSIVEIGGRIAGIDEIQIVEEFSIAKCPGGGSAEREF